MIDRRAFLRWGALGLGGLAVPTAVARAVAGGGGLGIHAAASPPVAPFTLPLRVPALLSPQSVGGVDTYEITMRPGSVESLPGIRTDIWGYEGTWPGPTIIARPGRPVVVRQRNELDVETTIHLHGGHVASAMDGQPDLALAPGGGTYDYEYPNSQLPASLWYHDHAMHATARNIYRGLAAFYLIVDEDMERSLGLPVGYGVDDIPLMLQDRMFDERGGLVYPSSSTPHGFVGDVLCVNGVAQPFLEVERRPYRFRIANAANFRIYELTTRGVAAHQVASDGALLAAPVAVAALPNRSIRLGVAERAEVVVDFSGLGAGATAHLTDAASGTDLVEFRVTGSSAAAGWEPTRPLRAIGDVGPAAVTRRIVLSFDSHHGMWVLNGKPFDPARIDARPRLGSTEVWEVFNDNGPGMPSMTHPFHMHLVQFRVLERGRDGVFVAPPANERGWKDTVRVEPGETVRFAARFDGFTGTYMYHCHIYEHEDHSMMAQLRVVDLARFAGADRFETAALASASTFAPGVPVVFVAAGGGFADALAGGPAAAFAGGPILLTAASSLPASTRAEIERLGPARAVVLGGEAAVAAAVEAELRSLVGPVSRLAGTSRFATAALVATETFDGPVAAAYVANGRGFADALAGGAAAAALGGPMLLTEPGSLPEETADALRRLAPATITVLGGEGAVSAAVEAELRSVAPTRRLAGATRYETAAAVVADAFPDGAETVFVATGEGFADALAAVPGAAALGAPLLLAPSAGEPPSAVTDAIRALRPARIRLLGGSAAIAADVEEALAALL